MIKPKAINRKKLVALLRYSIAEPTAHVNGRDERASPAVDKFARLRYMAIKGQQQKVLLPLFTLEPFDTLDETTQHLYNIDVTSRPLRTTEYRNVQHIER